MNLGRPVIVPEAGAPLQRTLDALAWTIANRVGPSHTLRCGVRSCGALLGQLGRTELGPLFFSASWTVDRGPVGWSVSIDGRQLRPREARRHLAETLVVTDESGPAVRDGMEDHWSMTILEWPVDWEQVTYPACMVRCADHGDAVLDRQWLIERTNEIGGTSSVTTSYPRVEYDDRFPELEHPAFLAVHATRTRTWTPRMRTEPLSAAGLAYLDGIRARGAAEGATPGSATSHPDQS